MEFKIEANNFKKATKLFKTFQPNKTQHEAQEGVQFRKNFLIYDNLNCQVYSKEILHGFQENEKVTLSLTDLNDFAKLVKVTKSSTSFITITLVNNNLAIAKYKGLSVPIKIINQNTECFEVQYNDSFIVNKLSLLQCLKASAESKDSETLNCLNFDNNYIVGTDESRVHLIDLKSMIFSEEFQFQVNNEILKKFLNNSNSEKIQVLFNNNTVKFNSENYYLIVKRKDSGYVNYSIALQKDFSNKLVAKSASFSKILELMKSCDLTNTWLTFESTETEVIKVSLDVNGNSIFSKNIETLQTDAVGFTKFTLDGKHFYQLLDGYDSKFLRFNCTDDYSEVFIQSRNVGYILITIE